MWSKKRTKALSFKYIKCMPISRWYKKKKLKEKYHRLKPLRNRNRTKISPIAVFILMHPLGFYL